MKYTTEGLIFKKGIKYAVIHFDFYNIPPKFFKSSKRCARFAQKERAHKVLIVDINLNIYMYIVDGNSIDLAVFSINDID